MNFEDYKNLIKKLGAKYPRLRNGEYSVPYINDFAKNLKMTIDADAFVLFTNDNKDFLETFGKRDRKSTRLNSSHVD